MPQSAGCRCFNISRCDPFRTNSVTGGIYTHVRYLMEGETEFMNWKKRSVEKDQIRSCLKLITTKSVVIRICSYWYFMKLITVKRFLKGRNRIKQLYIFCLSSIINLFSLYEKYILQLNKRIHLLLTFLIKIC